MKSFAGRECGDQRPHRLRRHVRVVVEPRAHLRRHVPTPPGHLPERLPHAPLDGVQRLPECCRHRAGRHRRVLHAPVQPDVSGGGELEPEADAPTRE